MYLIEVRMELCSCSVCEKDIKDIFSDVHLFLTTTFTSEQPPQLVPNTSTQCSTVPATW